MEDIYSIIIWHDNGKIQITPWQKIDIMGLSSVALTELQDRKFVMSLCPYNNLESIQIISDQYIVDLLAMAFYAGIMSGKDIVDGFKSMVLSQYDSMVDRLNDTNEDPSPVFNEHE